jgi:hypothetical protein
VSSPVSHFFLHPLPIPKQKWEVAIQQALHRHNLCWLESNPTPGNSYKQSQEAVGYSKSVQIHWFTLRYKI